MKPDELARLADGAVLVSMATPSLVTAVARKQAQPGKDFFPLTVNYQKRPTPRAASGGFFAAKAVRASPDADLALIDRPIRPLFPDGFFNEVQVVPTVISLVPRFPPTSPHCWAPRRLWPVGRALRRSRCGRAVGYKDGSTC